MRILQIIPRLRIGGAERLVLDICEELSLRNGINIALLVFDSINEFDKIENFPLYISDSFVKLSVFKSNYFNLEDYDRIISEFKPNIIHSHLFEAEILSRANIYPDIRYFSHFHDNMNQLSKATYKTFLSKRKLINLFERNWLLKRYYKSQTEFIGISNHTLEYIINNIPSNKYLNACLLPNAINLTKFNNVKKNNKLLNLNKIKLISVGSLVKKKNQQFQLKIVKELLNRGLDVDLLICGEGQCRSLIEKNIKSFGINSHVKLIGNVSNVIPHLNNSDIFIHTALYEPFGLVFLEAMASKIPIVTLNGKGNIDIIKDGYNALLVNDENNVNLFCNSIELILNNVEIRTKLVENAFDFVKQYDIKLYVNNLIKIYGK